MLFRKNLLIAAALAATCLVFWVSNGDAAAAGFGFTEVETQLINKDGTPDVQAGSHPWEIVDNVNFAESNEDIRDIKLDLPPGLVGNPSAVEQCTIEQFTSEPPPGTRSGLSHEACPTNSQIGVAIVKEAANDHAVGVFNLVAPPGVPGEVGFNISGVPVLFEASVRTGGDNGLTVNVRHVSQALLLKGVKVTLWGVPADPSHDGFRGACLGTTGAPFALGVGVPCPSSEPAKPFWTLPTSCPLVPPVFKISGDTWQRPGQIVEAPVSSNLNPLGEAVGVLGCDQLTFRPALGISPDTTRGDTPAGLTAEVKVPQDGLTVPEGLASATLRNTVVVLPEGLVINPGQATGLAACQTGENGLGSEDAPACPNASTVGFAELETPLLADKLKGNIYVLQSNPPNIQLLVALSGDGVNIKLVGSVTLDTNTGRLKTTFENTPDLPFTDFRLTFSGGAQAALASPTGCGEYGTNADFTPWSSPLGADAFSANLFSIDSGPRGSACAAPLPFSPAMEAGATTDGAGGYTSFSLLLQRDDGQQRIEGLQFKTPKGLLAMIRTVPLCSGAAADTGTCSAASQIGHTVVASGPGPFPLIVPQPGRPPATIYVTGPYKGAPYGLSIVVPVVVGPFDLGTVVVRGSIAVDSHTAQLTVTTDALPRILEGIPTDLRTINAVIDRPGFMFNPTDCSAESFTGTASSYEGATAALSTRFQVGSCQSLKFRPDFRVSTSGKTSRANGASLDAKVTYPSSSGGQNQATSLSNIASVKVDLPKQLPARLKTLQKACVASVFEANPASCPKASLIGSASAVTPVLAGRLSGPVYFVSHGGAAFPDLTIVLQGGGITIDLVAATFISKRGITSSTFRQVPDVPISSFELVLPKGSYSALAALGKLCQSKLAMPSAFTAHNGLVIKQSTKISITACPKTKKKASKH